MQSSHSSPGDSKSSNPTCMTLLALKIKEVISGEDYKTLVQDQDVVNLVNAGNMTSTDIVQLCSAMADHGQGRDPQTSTSTPTPTPHPQMAAPPRAEGGNPPVQPVAPATHPTPASTPAPVSTSVPNQPLPMTLGGSNPRPQPTQPPPAPPSRPGTNNPNDQNTTRHPAANIVSLETAIIIAFIGHSYHP